VQTLSCSKLLGGHYLDSGPVPEGHLSIFLVQEFVYAMGLYHSDCCTEVPDEVTEPGTMFLFPPMPMYFISLSNF